MAAHPDDEVLGCGGAIVRHASKGVSVHVLIMAEGITSRDATRDRESRGNDLTRLADTAQRVGAFLGVESVELLSFPDNRMDTFPLLDVIKEVEKRIKRISPSIVYTHHSGDLNVDHQITHKAVVTACRPFPGQCVKTLLFFEVLSSTDWQIVGKEGPFLPNFFLDISKVSGKSLSVLERKIHALQMYKSEMRPFPHSRSIEAVTELAKRRGASIGLPAAEGFMIGRWLR